MSLYSRTKGLLVGAASSGMSAGGGGGSGCVTLTAAGQSAGYFAGGTGGSGIHSNLPPHTNRLVSVLSKLNLKSAKDLLAKSSNVYFSSGQGFSSSMSGWVTISGAGGAGGVAAIKATVNSLPKP